MIRICSLAVFVCLAVAPSLRANPTQDLLRSVPADCSICFVAQDWKSHSQRIAESPFLAAVKKSELGRTILNPDAMEKIFALETILTEHLHLTVEQLRDDILGDAVLYAYRPGPTDKPDEDAGVLMLKAKDPKALAKLIDNFNDTQKQSGELKALTEKPLGKLAYFHRDKSDATGEYYFVRAGVFAFSKDESLLKATLALEATPAKTAPFLDAYDKLGLQKAAIAAIFQPRTLDAELKARIASTKDEHAQSFLKQFAKIWLATNSVAFAVELGTDVEIAVHASFDPKTVPPELKPFLGTPKASALWSHIPADVLFALAGKLDLPQLMKLGKTFLSEPGLKGFQELLDKQIAPAVGKDAFPELLKSIGPDWGVWLTAPGKTGNRTLPEFTVALRVRAPQSKDNTFGDALKLGLNFAFQMFRVDYNRTHDDQFTIREIKDDAGPIQHLENAKLLPPGVRPAFAQRGDFFLFASSPEAIQRFDPKKDTAKPEDAPFLRIGWKALEQYLRAHGEDFANLFSSLTGKTAADVLKEFRELQQVIELLDTLEVKQSGTVDSTKWSLKLKLTAPLQK